MPAWFQSRFLLLMLSVLLPGIAAAVWAVGAACRTEHQAIEQRLGETTRALARAVEGESVQRAAVTPARPIAAEAWQRTLDQQRLPAGWAAAVLDPEGRIVARHPGGTADAGRPAPPDLDEPRALRREGWVEVPHGFDGDPVMAYFSTSPQGWSVVTAMPRSQYRAAVASAALRVAGGALALLGLALAGAWWAARRIAGPAPHSAAGARLTAEQPASNAGRIEALGRLTGGVAHDFNNLLGIISNSAHLIQRQAHGVDVQSPLAATLRAVEAGSQLTQHLMRFATRQPAHPQPVDLSCTLMEWQALLKTVAGKRIEVSVAVSPSTRTIVVDPSELELALTQLTLNARDAMPSGGRLRVQACNADREDTAALPPGDYVLLTVGDDGKAEGSGIAPDASLAQVHEFCVRSGGTSSLASTPGLGTTVSMLLPAG